MASFTWPAGIAIGDARIAPGEPITSDLMTDYRDRDDYIQVLFDNNGAIGHTHNGVGEGPNISAGAFDPTAAGAALVLGGGGELAVNVDGTTISSAGDQLSIVAGGIHQGHLATALSSCSGAGNHIMTGGPYCFYPQVRSAVTPNTVTSQIALAAATNDLYVTIIYLTGTSNVWAQWIYVGP